MANKNHSFKYYWHQFWIMWHETKAHYYGSSWHEKRKTKHEDKIQYLLSNADNKISSTTDKTETATTSSPSDSQRSLDKLTETPSAK
ncbi:hypothetical protein CR194_00270 [Salipaludibacillus keqinensis]|jgi:hypothetical protein|uniref:Uncharacterized protein n=1 Tax=Salipaludibacillus keqinensis TaxID=2045207 RepID=A0A323TJ49_9BACI|nr:hypothetical protein [Salipaludibacillus keqinensis]PYZ94014.1 hypothetical protein CR194_00270 [Salipaludibacillus keqinensis]